MTYLPSETVHSSIPLPFSWPPKLASSVWWVAAINTVISEGASFITLIHPGFHVSVAVQAGVPMVAQLAATLGWVWALHTHKALVVTHKQLLETWMATQK